MNPISFSNARVATLAGPPRPRSDGELSHLGLLDKASFQVEAGRFAAIGGVVPGGEAVDLGGRLVLPGFVDAHTHLVFGGNRAAEFEQRCSGATYEEIARAGGGIRSTVAATNACSEEELLEAGQRHAHWLLANGTTTAEAKSGYGLSTGCELATLRAIRAVGETTPLRTVPTFLGLHAVPTGQDTDAFVDRVIADTLPSAAALAQFADAFLEAGYFNAAQVRRFAAAAKGLGLGLRLHADQLTNGGGAALAAELGAKTADHLEQTEAKGIAVLARAGVQPVLLPASVHCLGKKKYPAAREMIAAGLAIVLATDFNPGSSPTPSLPFVMNLACTQMGMSPAEAIVASTINAAYSLNLGAEVGSIEAGKAADFVVFDLEDPREVAYWVGAPVIHSVYRGGVRVA